MSPSFFAPVTIYSEKVYKLQGSGSRSLRLRKPEKNASVFGTIVRKETVGAEPYSADQRDGTPSSETLRTPDAVYPENLLEELLASWRAGACAAGRRLVSEVDSLAARVRDLCAETATLSVDQGEAE